MCHSERQATNQGHEARESKGMHGQGIGTLSELRYILKSAHEVSVSGLQLSGPFQHNLRQAVGGQAGA